MTARVRWALVAALLVGALGRLDAVGRLYPPDRDQRTDVRRYYQGMAESVLAGKGWIPTYPTNFIPPPGQAVFILIPKWLFPGVTFAQLRFLQAVVSTLTIFLGFRIATLLWGHGAGVATAWLLTLYFPLTYYVGTLVPETNYIACLFAFVFACVRAQRTPTIARVAVAGVSLGLAIAFKPVPTLLVTIVLPWIGATAPRSRRVSLVSAFVLAASVLPGAWIVRNALHYGHLYPVSTNGGTLLALANNEGLDPLRPDMMYWDDLYKRADIFRDPEIENRYAGVIDVDGKPEENLKDRDYGKKAAAYMLRNPVHFARNYFIKMGNFVVYPRPSDLPDDDRPWPFRRMSPFQDGMFLLGFLGMARLGLSRERRQEAALVLVPILYFLAMGALMHLTLDGRMNLPFRALLALPAGYVIAEIFQLFRQSGGAPQALGDRSAS